MNPAAFCDRPLVYLAGPYSFDPIVTTHEAVHNADAAQDTGLVTVYVPHLSMLSNLVKPKPVNHWYAWDLAMLARCDALWRIPGDSFGADNEVSFAIERHIPVFYDAASLLQWAASR